MRLQLVLLPYPVHCGRTDLLAMGHRSHAPVGCVLRRGLQGRVHDRCFLFGGDLFWSSAAWSVFNNARQTAALVTSTPQQNRWQRGGQLSRQHPIRNAFSGTQNHSYSEKNATGCTPMTADLDQFRPLRFTQDKFGCNWTRHVSSMQLIVISVKRFKKQETSTMKPTMYRPNDMLSSRRTSALADCSSNSPSNAQLTGGIKVSRG